MRARDECVCVCIDEAQFNRRPIELDATALNFGSFSLMANFKINDSGARWRICFDYHWEWAKVVLESIPIWLTLIGSNELVFVFNFTEITFIMMNLERL